MILAIDIGNTNIVIGGYENHKLTFNTRLATQRNLESDQYAVQFASILTLHGIDIHSIEGSVLSSVVPQITDNIIRALQTVFKTSPLVLSHNLDIGLNIKIDRPSELGLDLIAGVIGAKANYEIPAIVIDLGTATKITAVDANSNILGCSIAPGLFVSLNALTSTASALSGIAVKAPSHGKAIGTNTIYSMQSGVVFGTAAMLDGMIDRFICEMGKPSSILATGGAAGFIAPHCKHKVEHVPTLILDGLYHIYCKMNN